MRSDSWYFDDRRARKVSFDDTEYSNGIMVFDPDVMAAEDMRREETDDYLRSIDAVDHTDHRPVPGASILRRRNWQTVWR